MHSNWIAWLAECTISISSNYHELCGAKFCLSTRAPRGLCHHRSWMHHWYPMTWGLCTSDAFSTGVNTLKDIWLLDCAIARMPLETVLHIHTQHVCTSISIVPRFSCSASRRAAEDFLFMHRKGRLISTGECERVQKAETLNLFAHSDSFSASHWWFLCCQRLRGIFLFNCWMYCRGKEE